MEKDMRGIEAGAGCGQQEAGGALGGSAAEGAGGAAADAFASAEDAPMHVADDAGQAAGNPDSPVQQSHGGKDGSRMHLSRVRKWKRVGA